MSRTRYPGIPQGSPDSDVIWSNNRGKVVGLLNLPFSTDAPGVSDTGFIPVIDPSGLQWVLKNVGGDLFGTIDNLKVQGIQGIPVSAYPPTDQQIPFYSAADGMIEFGTLPGGGISGQPIPTTSELIGFEDQNGNLQPVADPASPLPVKDAVGNRNFENFMAAFLDLPMMIAECIVSVSRRNAILVEKAPSDETSNRNLLYSSINNGSTGEVLLIAGVPGKRIVIHHITAFVVTGTFTVSMDFHWTPLRDMGGGSLNPGNTIDGCSIFLNGANIGSMFSKGYHPYCPKGPMGQPLYALVASGGAGRISVIYSLE